MFLFTPAAAAAAEPPLHPDTLPHSPALPPVSASAQARVRGRSRRTGAAPACGAAAGAVRDPGEAHPDESPTKLLVFHGMPRAPWGNDGEVGLVVSCHRHRRGNRQQLPGSSVRCAVWWEVGKEEVVVGWRKGGWGDDGGGRRAAERGTTTAAALLLLLVTWGSSPAPPPPHSHTNNDTRGGTSTTRRGGGHHHQPRGGGCSGAFGPR